MGRRQCEVEGCTKQAVGGGTPHCSAHGGGKRCQEESCLKSAAPEGGTGYCKAHGGGRRCQHEGCLTSLSISPLSPASAAASTAASSPAKRKGESTPGLAGSACEIGPCCTEI
jgi:hypothetical protein